jgi:2-polyprenyl-3-methyl-5-hydroxy-6-metoxy-1,4-benzoquinol methylase
MDIEIIKWEFPPADHLWLEESSSESYDENNICDGCGGQMETICEVRTINGKLGLITGICPNCGYVKRVRNLPQTWYGRHFTKRWLTKRDEQLQSDEYVYRKIKKYIPNGGTVLDVGCGIGQRLLPFHEAGFQVFGIEPSLHRSQIGREKMNNITTGTAEEYLLNTGRKYDLIFIFNVLQFVENPFYIIDLAAKRLSNKGVLFFSVGKFYRDLEYCHFAHHGTLRSFLSLFSLKSVLKKNGLWPVEYSSSPFEMILSNDSSNEVGNYYKKAKKITTAKIENYTFGKVDKFKINYLGVTTVKYMGRRISVKKIVGSKNYVPTRFFHSSKQVPILLK